MEITRKGNVRGKPVSLSDFYFPVKKDICREPEQLPGLFIEVHIAVYMKIFTVSFPVTSRCFKVLPERRERYGVSIFFQLFPFVYYSTYNPETLI